jgi:hypothetical protein
MKDINYGEVGFLLGPIILYLAQTIRNIRDA